MTGERINLLLYTAILIMLVFAMAVLVWLQKRFEYDRQMTINNIHELFTVDLLNSPDYPKIDDIRLARVAAGNENSFLIRKIYVTKIVSGKGERVAYPWFFSGKNPDWRDHLNQLRKKDILAGNQKIGALYFDVNEQPIRNVRLAAWGLGVLLALTLIVIASRLWTQEREISRTTVELAEKSSELIRLERLALAGQLTSNVFHDIKKPVLNIKHEMVDLEDALKDLAGAVAPLQNIRQQVDLFFDMLRDLNLERFVKARDTDAEYLNINELLDRSLQLVKYEQGDVQVEREFEKDLPFVFALPYRLIQVYSNIILNAYQALGGKGTLNLVTRRRADNVEILISDDGPGIDPDILEVIFEPFYSTRESEGGSGLGLYISREIITRLDGDILVENRPEQGAAFTIRLPAAESES